MVGIVLVSHSAALARGLAELIVQVAGGEVCVVAAGGAPDGGLGTSGDRVSAAIARADRGDGVVILGDLGSAFLTVRHVLDDLGRNGEIRLADAPLVEGAVAAAVTASMGVGVDDVVRAAEEARGARKL
ncbi:MAG TPA: dihydroxyacetone kinase phosphoryl donor subunit DhaM [Candidatus Dormibacteraeota bacterium]